MTDEAGDLLQAAQNACRYIVKLRSALRNLAGVYSTSNVKAAYEVLGEDEDGNPVESKF